MDNQEFQRDSFEDSMAAFSITMKIRTFKPLHKPTQLKQHQIIAEI